jgi:hypothetical protein
MTSPAERRAAGLLLVLVPLAFTVCFTLLQQLFEYPDILRQPTADVLAKFQAGGAPLVAVWYALTATALLFVPLAVLVHRVLAARAAPTPLWLATVCGVLAGLVQTLGFLRWPFLVPHLADAYLAPGAGDAQRAAAALVFEAFHRYLGMGIGEHLGYLTTAAWTALVALQLRRSGLVPRWFGDAGLLLAAGIAAGLAEPAGWALGGTINTLSYLVWSVWLVALGVILLLRPAGSPATAPPVSVVPGGALS